LHNDPNKDVGYVTLAIFIMVLLIVATWLAACLNGRVP
jgi:hypothetical protein